MEKKARPSRGGRAVGHFGAMPATLGERYLSTHLIVSGAARLKAGVLQRMLVFSAPVGVL